MSSKTLEFFVKMRDLMSGGLAKLAQNSQNTFTKIKSNIATVSSSTKFFSYSIDELREKLRRVNEVRFGTVMKSEFNQASRAARQLETQITRMENKGSRRGGGLSSMVASYIGPLVVAAGLMSFGGSSIKSAMDFGATKKSFEVLTGSKATGNDLANNLNKLQQDTILGPEVFKAAQTMMGFGVATKDVEKNLKQLGDISMGNSDRFNSLTLAFSQTRAAGRLMGQDLLQYVNAGFNPLQTMSEHWKEFGFTAQKSVGDLKTAMEKGLITSDMVSMAIDIATSKGGKYFDMMNQMATTPYGKLKMLQGQWEALKIKTGEALMPLAELLMKAAGFLIEHTEYVKAAVAAWATYQIVSKAALLTQSIAAGAALGPIGLIAVAIGAIVLGWQMASAAQENYNKILADNAKSVYDREKEGIVADIKSLKGRSKLTDAEATKIILDSETNLIATGMRENAMKLQSATLQYEAAKGRDVHGDLSGMKGRIETLQGVQDNYISQRKALNDLKSTGISAASINGAGGGSANTTDTKDVAASITGGGPRVININGVKFTDKIEFHVANMIEGTQEVERKLEEMFLRILNSGASVQ